MNIFGRVQDSARTVRNVPFCVFLEGILVEYERLAVPTSGGLLLHKLYKLSGVCQLQWKDFLPTACVDCMLETYWKAKYQTDQTAAFVVQSHSRLA